MTNTLEVITDKTCSWKIRVEEKRLTDPDYVPYGSLKTCDKKCNGHNYKCLGYMRKTESYG